MEYDIVPFCEIFLATWNETSSQRPKGGNNSMNKYELAVVVSAKIEDDARTAVIEKVKRTIEKHGGQVICCPTIRIHILPQ